MSLNNFERCAPDHKEMQYICYGRQKSFCKSCFRKHRETCVSSRCGDVRRLCYSILEKFQYYKLKKTLQLVNPTPQEYSKLKDLMGNNYNNFAKCIKDHIEKKVPFMVLQLQNLLVDNLVASIQSSNISFSSSALSQDLNKQKALYPRLKSLLIKQKADNEDLDYVIAQMNDINNLDKDTKELSKKRAGTENSDMSNVSNHGLDAIMLAQSIKKQLEYNMDIRDDLDRMLSDRLKDIALRLSRTHSINTYEVLENLKAEIMEQPVSLDNIEHNPDQMLQVAKHIMKKSLFDQYVKLGETRFPYKYCYLISTCATADLNYEKLVLSLEKKLVDSIQAINQSMLMPRTLDQLTKRIIIMGPQVIEVEFCRQKPFPSFHMNIYGYQDTREEYYQQVPTLLGIIQRVWMNRTNDSNRRRLNQPLPTALDVAFHNIEVTCSLIFKEHLIESEQSRRDQGKKFMQLMLPKGAEPGTTRFEERKMKEFSLCSAE